MQHRRPGAAQLVDKRQDLVRVQRLASFNSINIQASAAGAAHVLADDESPTAGAAAEALAAGTAPLKGGDGMDRLLEYRCGRYLFHHGEATFLPVPPLPTDFGPALAAVAGSRNVKGAAARGGGRARGCTPLRLMAAWRPGTARSCHARRRRRRPQAS